MSGFEWRWWKDYSTGHICGYRAFDQSHGIIAVAANPPNSPHWQARRIEPGGSDLVGLGRSRNEAASALLALEFQARQDFEPQRG